jgi:hypothetical protein
MVRRVTNGCGRNGRTDFAERELGALLAMELPILLERERAAGVINWRYRSCILSLVGRLGVLVARGQLGHYRSELGRRGQRAL